MENETVYRLSENYRAANPPKKSPPAPARPAPVRSIEINFERFDFIMWGVIAFILFGAFVSSFMTQTEIRRIDFQQRKVSADIRIRQAESDRNMHDATNDELQLRRLLDELYENKIRIENLRFEFDRQRRRKVRAVK